jgi:hypothetical protein
MAGASWRAPHVAGSGASEPDEILPDSRRQESNVTASSQERLFDFEPEGEEPYAVLISAPQTHGDATVGALATDALRRACTRYARHIDRRVAVLTGDDAGSTDPHAVPRWLRTTLGLGTDAVLVVHGGSWGSSLVHALAEEMLIPHLLACDLRRRRSATAGSSGRGLSGEAGFCSYAELEECAFAWLCASHDDIAQRHAMRTQAQRLSDDFRKPCLRAWERREPGQQREIASGLGLHPEQLTRLLVSEGGCAEEHFESMLRLSRELGVWDAGNGALVDAAASPRAVLSSQQLDTFEQAKRLKGWDPITAEAVLRRGMLEIRRQQLECATGQRLRPRDVLKSRFSWIGLWRRMCNELG